MQEHAPLWLATGAAVASPLSIAASQILLGAALLALLVTRTRPAPLRQHLPLILFMAWTALSMALADDPWAGRPQIRKFYVFLILVALGTALRRPFEAARLWLAAIAAATVSALWALAQFVLKYNAAREAGRDFYTAYIADRITGFMSHWMTFGGHMMIFLLGALAFLLFAPHARVKTWVWAAAAILFAALVLNLTRGIWIGTFVGAAYLVRAWRPRLLLATPLLLAVVWFAAPEAVRSRAISIFRPHGDTDSNSHRIVTWRTGLAMIQEHPLFGVGPENISRQFNHYVPADIPWPLPAGFYGHLHNIYLQYGAERGLPALALFLWWMVSLARDLKQRTAQAAPEWQWLPRAAVAVTIGMLVGGVFEHNLGDSEVLMAFLATLVCGRVAEPEAVRAG